MRKQQNSDEVIAKKLYGDNKNTFYRLKNRLKEDIGKSLLVQHSKETIEQEIINDVLLANHFYRKREHEITKYYLKKAEKKAIQAHSLDLLELIYSDQIKLARETVKNNPEKIIQKKRENRQRLNKLSELDDLLAVVMYRIKASQNYSSKSDNILELLSKTIQDYTSEENIKANPVVRFKIYHGVSRILLQNQDFVSLEAYLKETLTSFEDDDLFNKRNHDTQLQMLTYLCNALFKNEKHQESLEWAEKLLVAMRLYNYELYNKYLFYYYNSLYYNYSVINRDKASKILEEAAEEEVIQQEPLNITFIILQLAVYYFDEKAYKKARKQLTMLQLNDGFDQLDPAFKIKIILLEAMTVVEINDMDLVEDKLKRLEVDYSRLNWNEIGCDRELIMTKIIPLLIINRDAKEEARFSKLKYELKNHDSRLDLINYQDWVQQKNG
ncbi:MAG: hypothetical protein JKY54_15825 [Flavobacteriales bacterium]|nr:hypothetical protein [Flavobacteriales bacterium]